MPNVTIFLHSTSEQNSKVKSMGLQEPRLPVNTEPSARSRRYALWYLQQEGLRFYLRFTLLGVIVVVLLTIIPIIAIFSLFIIGNSSSDIDNVNISITPRAPSYDDTRTLIKPAPPPPTLPKVRQYTNTNSRNNTAPTPSPNSNEEQSGTGPRTSRRRSN